MVIPDPATLATIVSIGTKLADKTKKKKKISKSLNSDEGESNPQKINDPFAAVPAKGQPVVVKNKLKKIFGS